MARKQHIKNAMTDPDLAALISEKVRHWYRQNLRALPFRQTKDPYLIWLSEVILQQTQVKQGLPYYEKFKEAYPRVEDLAAATEEEVLRLWQGLGYYSRGRNLHSTAQIVASQYDGHFPQSYSELIKLKGIGTYTAAAIASFAFGEPAAVLDGNVFRVLSRLWGNETDIASSEGKRVFTHLAQALLPSAHAAEHNYAMMEFGSLHCKPQKPLCASCPLSDLCVANLQDLQDALPYKSKKIKVKERHLHYFVVEKEHKWALKRREDRGIWAGLYDFPCIETQDSIPPIHKAQPVLFFAKPYKHLLTHQRLWLYFWALDNLEGLKEKDYNWYSPSEVASLPKPRPMVLFYEAWKAREE